MRLTIVGSGASAVHCAATALDRGLEVEMIDVGRHGANAVRPHDSFERLKETHLDPAAYFLGERFEAVSLPDDDREYYGFPPNKLFVFEGVDGFRQRSSGFTPLLSFARGGLAETWTAGVFPFHDAELADFPFGLGELMPYYDRIAARIGVSGVEDDLAAHFPVHRHLEEPLRLDDHSRDLLERAAARRDRLAREARCVVGRSRIATLSRPHGERPACTYLGRCLTGCPTGALYTPSMTLAECARRPGFTYTPGRLARVFRIDASRRITSLVMERVEDGALEERPVETLVLAAGTLASSKIVLDSWWLATGERPQLTGLMDNRQVLVPFVNWSRIGRAHDPDTYQYHQIAFALPTSDPRETIHALVTTLKSAMIHPIVKSLPFDMATSLAIFGDTHGALGLVNVNFPDHRREECSLSIEPAPSAEARSDPRAIPRTTLIVRYVPAQGERARIRAGLARVRRALRVLGCFVPPGMSHVRPMGASVHYAGTIPMSAEARPWTTAPDCRFRGIENLFLADGTTFPFLPAKNLTFTLMANASRIADGIGLGGS